MCSFTSVKYSVKEEERNPSASIQSEKPKATKPKKITSADLAGLKSTLGPYQPIEFLRNIKGYMPPFIELGSYELQANNNRKNRIFTVGLDLEGSAYSGSGSSLHEARENCAVDALKRHYNISGPPNGTR